MISMNKLKRLGAISLIIIYQFSWAKTQSLVTVYQDLETNGDYAIMIKEMERSKNRSQFLVDLKDMSRNSSVGSSILIACTISYVGKVRGYPYWVKLKESFKPRTTIEIGYIHKKEEITQFKHFAKTQGVTGEVMPVNYFDPICKRLNPKRVTIKPREQNRPLMQNTT